ncbi:ribosome hibernation-promoting factor, HPF/YfiA family [Methylovirgula sp. 4M-Z18]|uniref:ribosome hibernation-promoting factor, HPF/YfiA family n=1 Tax=Methylovirgula sp. 4M-Z18 TaxID=2293567 RepID=UPI000E2E869C|nr:ribosome-associated translation inhibitor RaiA [Methylovirgula sp. 4M-Z18]RFB77989.1 ribosome-associated translation inhibitor RaiA [Methylovirgula sp. 4M-Z18]
MTLRVSGKNFDIGEALRTHVQDRIAGAIGKYYEGRVGGHVTLEPEGSGYRTDCTLHLSSGITLQAEALAHEPYASFDQAADRIEKRLSRYKRRLKDHHGPNGVHEGEERVGAIMAAYVLEAPDEDADEIHDFNPVVVAESTARLRELSVSAAVMDLDLSGAPVIVFRHATNGRVNIVYRRSDGHVGWIDPATPSAKA